MRSPQLSPQALQSWVHSDMVILLYGFHFPLFLIHYPPKEPVRPWEGECLLFPVGQILPPLGQGLPVAGGAGGRGNSTLFGLASVFLCHAANPPIAARLSRLFAAGAGVPLALALSLLYGADIVISVRSAFRIGDRLASTREVSSAPRRKVRTGFSHPPSRTSSTTRAPWP